MNDFGASGHGAKETMTRYRFLLPLFFLVAFASSRPAFAQTSPKVVVVTVDASAELDAVALRRAIGDELGMVAVAPDDARAGAAIGTIAVAVDRATRKLVVTYRAHAAPITREVPLPDDAAATSRAAVVLAGNLARDEASELAGELRKRAPKPPPPPAKTPDAGEAPSPRDDSKLDLVLAYNAEQARAGRRAFGWSALALGVTTAGTGIYLTARGSHEPGGSLGAIATVSLITGIVSLTSTSELESLWILRQNGTPGDTVEARWAKLAESEHRTRHNASVVAVLLGSVALTFGVIQTVYAATASSPSDFTKVTGPLSIFGGAVYLIGGAYGLATDGPMESSLRLYERAVGREVAPEALASRFRLAIVPGGAVAGFGGAF